MKNLLFMILILVSIISCSQKPAKIVYKGEKSYSFDSDAWMKRIEENNRNNKNKIGRPFSQNKNNEEENSDSQNSQAKKVEIIKSNIKFKWPVNGKVIVTYGPKAGGIRHDGINIAAPIGTPVKASASGEIIYVTDELVRYGNLVIIQHDQNWYSAYSHLDKILKKKGEKVKQGQIIGLVGQTGNVSEPQLHFGIRKGKEPLNPMHYLQKKIRLKK